VLPVQPSTELNELCSLVPRFLDSVLIGKGATDDGVAVTVCLEMIRNLVNHPVKHNVIFNINNGEEVGLYGAAAFMKHPWAKDVKAFVNLGMYRILGASFQSDDHVDDIY